MHPEVVRQIAGQCPICGMALELIPIFAGKEDSSELEDMSYRFKLSLIFTLPLFLLTMSESLLLAHSSPWRVLGLFGWIQAALATPVVFWAGWPLLQRAGRSFRTGHFNMFTLIGMGVSAAYLFSLGVLVFPDHFLVDLETDGDIPLYFESAAVIVCLVLLGQVLELRAISKTSSSIKSLSTLAPASALRVNPDGSSYEVSLNDIHVGDLLRVKPGGKVPVDGILLTGVSSIDESMITGESIPVAKQAGSVVIAGTINQTGTFDFRAEKVGKDTLLAQIIFLVSEAARSRAPIQKIADVVSSFFVPIVIAISFLAFLVWGFMAPAPSLSNALVVAVSVLIIACPCALGLATPISIVVGIGRSAQEGVLIKDAESLERMEQVDTLVIDKTGTLTEGVPKLQKVIAISGFSEQQVLITAAALEIKSEHPLAKAITNYAYQQRVTIPTLDSFKSVTGSGVEGVVNGELVFLGNDLSLIDRGIDVSYLDFDANRLRSMGHTVIYLAIGEQLAGLISVSDSIKPTAIEAIASLRNSGLRIVLLTGDNRMTALAVSARLAIDEVQAEVLPHDKYLYVKNMQAKGHVVAMAGDGVNDAPAIAAADVGIAMGTGTDAAMQSARIVLIKGDLLGIVKARSLSKKIMSNIRQNLFFAFFYNFLGVPIAGGVLYPFFGILLSPMIASMAMSLSSLSVITNALRLRK